MSSSPGGMGHPLRLSPAGPPRAPLAPAAPGRARETRSEGPLRDELPSEGAPRQSGPLLQQLQGGLWGPSLRPRPFPKRFFAASAPAGASLPPRPAACAGPAAGPQADAFLTTNGSKQIIFS